MPDRKLRQCPERKIVVLGTGFAGMSFLETLHSRIKKDKLSDISVTGINATDFMLFSPLLYQIATAQVSDKHISIHVSERVRGLGFSFIAANIMEISLESNKIVTSEGEIFYDYLIISLGTENNDFGVKGVIEHAIPLKSLRDGLEIRHALQGSLNGHLVLDAVGVQEASHGTFVVVGGGASGIELAGSIAEYVNAGSGGMGGHFHVELIEAKDNLVSENDKQLSKIIVTRLQKSGVKVRLSSKVEEITGSDIKLSNGETIKTSHVFWAAGVRNSKIIAGLRTHGLTLQSGRIMVNGNLRALGSGNVFVLGDNSFPVISGESLNVPQTAAAAVQEGRYAARALEQLLVTGSFAGFPSFKFRNSGIMVSIGKFNGVCKLPSGVILTGFPGWLLWRFVHLLKVRPMRNRLGVLWDWIHNLLPRNPSAPGRKLA